MERYHNDKKFRDIYTRVITMLEKINNSSKFLNYDYDPNPDTLMKYMKEFMTEYKNDLCLDDFLEAISKPLEKREYPKPINFLTYILGCNISSYQKAEIIKYIYKVYSDQINEYQKEIIRGLDMVFNEEKRIECIELFSDEKYNCLHKVLAQKQVLGEVLYYKFIDKCRRLKLVEKENEEMKNENMDLRKKIEDLELQIKYMPHGVGYLEAKEHFDSLKN
jgi:hypothetical protein